MISLFPFSVSKRYSVLVSTHALSVNRTLLSQLDKECRLIDWSAAVSERVSEFWACVVTVAVRLCVTMYVCHPSAVHESVEETFQILDLLATR